MNRSLNNVVDLERTFLEVPDSAAGLDSEAAFRAALLWGRSEDWDAVLSHPYVVVLGEAGTGKSTEFLLQAQALTAKGKCSFFVELTDLAENGLILGLDVNEKPQLVKWQESQDDAVFFLDSLDEAKLQNRTLQRALRNLKHSLQDHWERVRLVVSCRVSDWMAEADRAELHRIAPPGVDDIHIVQIAPLNTCQVEELARSVGVEDVKEFMAAIIDSHAQIFIERPLDVMWLGSYWLHHQCIGSLRELIADNVREKLKERRNRKSDLPLTKAAAGVQTLAGVAAINNTWSFILPDDVLELHHKDEVIDPSEFLPNWSSTEVSELLRRSLFDEATYGRVRLHHRSVQEFLAAKWVADLAASGMTNNKVAELFIHQQNGETVIPAHLKPVAAWLALWDEELRRLLIDTMPSLLIGHGDPSGFSDEERGRILRSYVELYQDRARRFERFDQASLQRFASSALSEQINNLLMATETPDELLTTLLQIIERGQIHSCADTCLSLALNYSRSNEVRYYAIKAVAAVGTNAHNSGLLNLLQSTTEWEQDVAGAFVRALYPQVLDIHGLIQLLASTKPKRRNMNTMLQNFLECDVPQIGTLEFRCKLLVELLNLIWVDDSLTDTFCVPTRHLWLLTFVAELISKILDETKLDEHIKLPDCVLVAFDMFRWVDKKGLFVWYGLDEVKSAIERHPEVKRQLFWRKVHRHSKVKGAVPTRMFELPYSYDMFKLQHADCRWLAHDAKSMLDIRERLLAFDTLVRTYSSNDNQDSRIEFLRGVAGSRPELLKRLNRMMNPRLSREGSSLPRIEREQRAHELKEERLHDENKSMLERNVEKVRNGTHYRALCFLYSHAENINNSYGEIELDNLIKKYGAEIAEAAVLGWRAYWRTFDPPPTYDREEQNSTPSGAVLGLVGLNFDFASEFDVSFMNMDEVRRATRYAAWELNSFPIWLSELAKVHGDIVVEVLCPELVADLKHPDDGTDVYNVLIKVVRSDSAVKSVLMPCVAKQILAEEPPTVQALADALDILISVGLSESEEFVALSRKRCLLAVEEPKRFAVWWKAYLAFDSTGALDVLEDVVDRRTSEQADELMLHVCNHLYDYKGTGEKHIQILQEQPKILARLIPFVYQYIRPEDDVEHEEAHFIGPRENAQELRDKLVSWLADGSTGEAVRLLRKLAGDPRLAGIRDGLLYRADRQLVANATLTAPTVLQHLTDLCRTYGTDMQVHLDKLPEEKRMERFDVGIMTMKEEEYDALLDKFGATTHVAGCNRDYDVVTIETSRGKCHVAITRCAHQGTAFAQAAASEILSDLNPRFFLVVGIAGGVPTPDFSLGDVVVSDYIHDLTLEDTGVGPGSERYSASGGPLQSAAGRIVERLRAIERTVVGWNAAESIGCERPNLNGEYTTDDVAWNDSIAEALAILAQRDSPIATARRIASSDRLIKNPKLLQDWRRVLKGVAAVEMESAGPYVLCQRNNVPFLAIRGISDIVGWKRDEAWTLYACHVAAAYTRMLVDTGAFVVEV